MDEQVFRQIHENPEVYRELESTRCVCGSRKGAGKTFCWNCWCSLSESVKKRLWDSIGYPDAVADAKSQLRAKGRIV